MIPRLLVHRFAAAPPRLRSLLVGGAGAVALLLAANGDPLLATAGRGSLVVLGLGALAAWVRRPSSHVERPFLVEVCERHTLSRDAAIALLRVRGRSLLVGYGPDGVRLVAELDADDGGGAP